MVCLHGESLAQTAPNLHRADSSATWKISYRPSWDKSLRCASVSLGREVMGVATCAVGFEYWPRVGVAVRMYSIPAVPIAVAIDGLHPWIVVAGATQHRQG